jgi:predicted nucleic-acid-binding Zn-ribbon protein
MLSCLYYTGTQPLTDSGNLTKVSNGIDSPQNCKLACPESGVPEHFEQQVKMTEQFTTVFTIDKLAVYETMCRYTSLELFVLSDYFSCRTTPIDRTAPTSTVSVS